MLKDGNPVLVKFFSHTDLGWIERLINEFFSEQEQRYELIDVKYSVTAEDELSYTNHYVMVLYRTAPID